MHLFWIFYTCYTYFCFKILKFSFYLILRILAVINKFNNFTNSVRLIYSIILFNYIQYLSKLTLSISSSRRYKIRIEIENRNRKSTIPKLVRCGRGMIREEGIIPKRFVSMINWTNVEISCAFYMTLFFLSIVSEKRKILTGNEYFLTRINKSNFFNHFCKIIFSWEFANLLFTWNPQNFFFIAFVFRLEIFCEMFSLALC